MRIERQLEGGLKRYELGNVLADVGIGDSLLVAKSLKFPFQRMNQDNHRRPSLARSRPMTRHLHAIILCNHLQNIETKNMKSLKPCLLTHFMFFKRKSNTSQRCMSSRFMSVVSSRCCSSSFSQQHVDLLLNPFFIVGGIGVGRFLVNQNAQILQLIHKVEKLGDIVRDGWLK